MALFDDLNDERIHREQEAAKVAAAKEASERERLRRNAEDDALLVTLVERWDPVVRGLFSALTTALFGAKRPYTFRTYTSAAPHADHDWRLELKVRVSFGIDGRFTYDEGRDRRLAVSIAAAHPERLVISDRCMQDERDEYEQITGWKITTLSEATCAASENELTRTFDRVARDQFIPFIRRAARWMS